MLCIYSLSVSGRVMFFNLICPDLFLIAKYFYKSAQAPCIILQVLEDLAATSNLFEYLFLLNFGLTQTFSYNFAHI